MHPLFTKLATQARAVWHRVSLVADDPAPEPTMPPAERSSGTFVMRISELGSEPEVGAVIPLSEFASSFGLVRVRSVVPYMASPTLRVVTYTRVL